MRFDAVINKFVFEANFDNRITIQGDGKQSRSFIHIDLVSKALNNLLTVDLPRGTYNLVERNLKVFDIVDVLKQLVPNLEFTTCWIRIEEAFTACRILNGYGIGNVRTSVNISNP